jgi:hypothetical protein
MRLNAKMLKNVSNVNHWEYAEAAFVQEGQANSFYIQLVDLDKIHPGEKSKILPDFPLRYMSQAAVFSVEVVFLDVNPDNQFTVTATQPFADDKSIFRIDLTEEQVPNSGNLQVNLTEDGVTKRFLVKGGIKVEMQDVGGC